MNKKTWIIAGIVGLVLFGSGFFVGRRNAPVVTKIVETEKRVVVEKETSTVQQKVDIAELVKAVQEVVKKNNVVTTRVVVRAPDGTVTEKEVVSDKSETDSKSKSDASKNTKSETEVKLWKETTRVEEKYTLLEKKLELKWAIDLQVGYSIPSLFGSGPGFNLVPYSGVVGAIGVYRHVLGPAWLGVWGQTTGVVGAGLRFSW